MNPREPKTVNPGPHSRRSLWRGISRAIRPVHITQLKSHLLTDAIVAAKLDNYIWSTYMYLTRWTTLIGYLRGTRRQPGQTSRRDGRVAWQAYSHYTTQSRLIIGDSVVWRPTTVNDYYGETVRTGRNESGEGVDTNNQWLSESPW
jgi:hypothetical protein